MDIFKAFIPLTKVDDEQRMVYGYASTETIDSQGEVVERAAIEAALPDYMKFANIREMHTMSAVGVAKSAEVDEKGLYIGAKVVDETAWMKVKEGVYKGFSIGGRALSKMDGVIKSLRLSEISLVDRPANPECVIDAWKADTLDEPAPEPEKVEKGVWNVQRLVEALQTVRSACESCDYETKNGEHSTELNQEMRATLSALASVTQRYLGEEIALMLKPAEAPNVVAMADGASDDVAKAGAKYSKSTREALAKMHGMIRECEKAMCDMGYDKDDSADKADDQADIAKADALVKAESDLAKAVQERDDLAKRVAELESQPEPAKAATTTIEKSDDTKDGLAASAPTHDANDPLSMFKAALSRPLAMAGTQFSKPSSAN
jgi:HK97 family phage prohead protease